MFSREMNFTIPGRPVTWKRTNSYKGRRLSPAQQDAMKAQIAWLAKAQTPRDWPMKARYAVAVQIIKNDSIDVGDCDNYLKLICDAVKRICYDDDRLVRIKVVGKGLGTERVYTEIGVLENPDNHESLLACATLGRLAGSSVVPETVPGTCPDCHGCGCVHVHARTGLGAYPLTIEAECATCLGTGRIHPSWIAKPPHRSVTP